MKCVNYGRYEGLVVMVCYVRWSLLLVLNGVKACLGVRENADPFIMFVFVSCDMDGY